MSTMLGSLRRLVMAPSLDEVTFGRRGFPVEATAATRALEAIPQSVICGFEWGIDTRDQGELERRLDFVVPELRGFAYEGATMACTILDVMRPRRGHRTADLLLGPGQPHIFLAYIGIGFAMARLPRVLWKKVVPDLTGSAYYPTMSWLAVDGYGFDRAYFDTARWVERQEKVSPYPWEGSPGYFPRAADQGIGRALWFICGGHAPQVAAAVRRFAGDRRADLWSGAGLAAAFAGGSESQGLAVLRREAGEHWPELAQGAVFAVKARAHAGFVPAHTEAAAAALADLTVQGAVELADAAEAKSVPAGPVPAGTVFADTVPAGPVPAYEEWRRNVQAHFSSKGASAG